MAWAYSLDLRERVVDSLLEGELTYEQIAERFKVGRATVSRLGRRFRETGSFEPSKTRGHAPRTLTDGDQAVLLEIVTDRPDETLAELCDQLAASTGKRISSATVGRELRRAGFTRKKRPSSRSSRRRSASRSFAPTLSTG